MTFSTELDVQRCCPSNIHTQIYHLHMGSLLAVKQITIIPSPFKLFRGVDHRNVHMFLSPYFKALTDKEAKVTQCIP